MITGAEIQVAGEALLARGDGTLYWPDERILFVADVHLGKAAAFRAVGRLPLPTGTTSATLGRLAAALLETEAVRLIVLGDLWHARRGRNDATMGEFAAFRRRFFHVKTTLIEGNHDLRSGALPEDLAIEQIGEGERLGPFVLRHHPASSPDGYVLAGHVHPGAVLTGAGQGLRLPCFWFGREVGLLPAFGEFTGLGAISPARGDRVIVLAEGHPIVVGSKSRP